MRFAPPSAPARPEAVVPMINVVFLLLVFFMITSRIAPPPPLEVDPPEAQEVPTTRAESTLWIDASGGLAFGSRRGEAVWDALADLPDGARLTLAADRNLPISELARLLARLGSVAEIELLVRE